MNERLNASLDCQNPRLPQVIPQLSARGSRRGASSPTLWSNACLWRAANRPPSSRSMTSSNHWWRVGPSIPCCGSGHGHLTSPSLPPGTAGKMGRLIHPASWLDHRMPHPSDGNPRPSHVASQQSLPLAPSSIPCDAPVSVSNEQLGDKVSSSSIPRCHRPGPDHPTSRPSDYWHAHPTS